MHNRDQHWVNGLTFTPIPSYGRYFFYFFIFFSCQPFCGYNPTYQLLSLPFSSEFRVALPWLSPLVPVLSCLSLHQMVVHVKHPGVDPLGWHHADLAWSKHIWNQANLFFHLIMNVCLFIYVFSLGFTCFSFMLVVGMLRAIAILISFSFLGTYGHHCLRGNPLKSH